MTASPSRAASSRVVIMLTNVPGAGAIASTYPADVVECAILKTFDGKGEQNFFGKKSQEENLVKGRNEVP